MKTFTPFGIKDLIPSEAKKQEEILQIAVDIFEKWGYQKIITPSIEYYDSLKQGLGDNLDQIAIKFFDPEGHSVVLRPDYTVPIARVVASRMKDAPKPIKLYYIDSVFRKPKKGNPHDSEIFQAGIELIGETGPQSEADVIAICCEILLGLGFKDFGIDIGHVDFVKGLSEEKKSALINGDYLTFGEIPRRGGVEILNDHKELSEFYRLLKEKKYDQYVHFNKGLVKDMDYYSGIIFESYINGIGSIVGSGGRYDHLIEKFGFKTPAVGFSLNINLLLASPLLKEK